MEKVHGVLDSLSSLIFTFYHVYAYVSLLGYVQVSVVFCGFQKKVSDLLELLIHRGYFRTIIAMYTGKLKKLLGPCY